VPDLLGGLDEAERAARGIEAVRYGHGKPRVMGNATTSHDDTTRGHSPRLSVL